MQDWIISVMQQYGYLGVFLLIMVENLFPPIPSEIILTFGGFMTLQTDLTALGVITVSTLGSVMGAIILYKIGTILNIERLNKITEKYGKFLRLKQSDIDSAMKWYEKYEYKTVFFCRMIPIVRSLISIPAGMAEMKFTPFVLLTLLGSLIWNTLLVSAGVLLGEAWEKVLKYMDIYSLATYIIIGSVCLIGAVLYIRKKRKEV